MADAAPYPWNAIERVSHAAATRARLARRALGRRVDGAAVGAALGSLTDADVEIVVRGLEAADAPRSLGADTRLAFGDETIVIASMEPELAAFALARILNRPVPVSASGVPLDPALEGALAAIAIETARRCGTRAAIAPLSEPPPDGGGIELDLVVLCDGRSFRARCWIASQLWRTPDDDVDRLERAGELPVAVPVVAAVAAITRDDLGRLGVGDAFMPGDGWWLASDGTGAAVLAAPSAESGARVQLSGDGAIVIRGDRVPLTADAADEPMGDSDTLNDAVLDAPVVVRVEVGSVSMTAREWSRLSPGDVVGTGSRLAEPVVLRVAGREVGRGDLVNVDGEVGVRIREIARGAAS